jgi:hypothetical protein
MTSNKTIKLNFSALGTLQTKNMEESMKPSPGMTQSASVKTNSLNKFSFSPTKS